MSKKKKSRTIGEMTNSRRMWAVNPNTQVIANKKGKGSYARKSNKV